MPSGSNHSPGAPVVSSAGSPASKNAGELDPLDALIVESERAALMLAAVADDPAYQAALADLADQSARAADALLDLERATVGPQSPWRLP